MKILELAKGLVTAGIAPLKASEDALHVTIDPVSFANELQTEFRIAEQFRRKGLFLPFICTHEEIRR